MVLNKDIKSTEDFLNELDSLFIAHYQKDVDAGLIPEEAKARAQVYVDRLWADHENEMKNNADAKKAWITAGVAAGASVATCAGVCVFEATGHGFAGKGFSMIKK